MLSISVLPCAAENMFPSTVGGGFGVQIKPSLIDAENLSRIHALGFSFVRFSLGWQGVEIAKNTYDWRDSDDLIAQVRAHRLKMVIPILGSHALYGGMISAPQKNTDNVKDRPIAPRSPEAMDAFARFAAQLVLRYGSDDIVWEIWNEPDIARFWPPQADVHAYAVMAELACTAMRRVDLQARIIGPALGRVPDVRDGVPPFFINNFLASGGAMCFDAISVHPYRHGAEEPEAVYADYATLIGLMARNRIYVPLVNSEWGYTTTQASDAQQAAYVLRARLTDMIWGVPLSVWYEWKDSRDDPHDPEGHFGLITREGKDKPALHEIELLLPQLKEAVLERQIPAKNPRDIVLLLRKDDGERILVGWSLRPVVGEPAQVTFKVGKKTRTGILGQRPVILGQEANFDTVTVK